MKKTALVIGYGNELRGDDAIGQIIAKTIKSWNLNNVESLAVHQLTPELAANLATVNLVIFVDACINSPSEDVQVKSILPSFDNAINGHITNSRSLLALTQTLYGCCPQAWLVSVPGINFEISDSISSIAENGIAIALNKIIQILDKYTKLWM
ncbi:hydrogenase maturation protease [Cronbergia sp. UHCC 0137]|uniref:hydrogenase maturation protease n=1 Tax=Cronbergia sp. UHCC 0137 TaxID=3110239 RepID=UPI002B219397|nr:hydrogenase maturation protease [Cronbergia sp. UHCC 0137]MEA5618646.1 hydrogenase maturation protease [Cronbergia sp. UHCC 0137]